MAEQTARSPRVFISYSHDFSSHADRVLRLSDRLRTDGVDTVLDQYESAPPEGWPRWMEREVREADFVLAICTETYQRRVENREDASVGRGVRWEGMLIQQHIYNSDTANSKFVPVLIGDANEEHIPVPFQGATHYRIEEEFGYEALYRRLTGQLQADSLQLDDPERAGPLRILLAVALSRGDYAEAEKLCRETLAIQTRTLGLRHPNVAWALARLGEVLSIRDKNAEAEQAYLQSLSILRAVLRPRHPDIAVVLNNLGVHYTSEGRIDEAERVNSEAEQILTDGAIRDNVILSQILANRGDLLRQKGRIVEGEELQDARWPWPRDALGLKPPWGLFLTWMTWRLQRTKGELSRSHRSGRTCLEDQ